MMAVMERQGKKTSPTESVFQNKSENSSLDENIKQN